MGTIQNSVNQLIGTVTAGIGVGKHVAEQAKANELNAISQADNLVSEADKLGKEAKALDDKSTGIFNAQQDEQSHLENLENGNANYQDLSRDEKGRWMNVEHSITKRELAMKSLQEQEEAVRSQKEQFMIRTELYNRKLDALNAIKKDIAPDLNKVLPKEQLKAVDTIKKEVKNNG